MKHPSAEASYKQDIVQWFPGHIAKLQNTLKQKISLLDVGAIVLDARLPGICFNQEALAPILTSNKPLIVVLNKCDLADPEITEQWQKQLEAQGYKVATISSKRQSDAKALRATLIKLGAPVWEQLTKKGLKKRPLRLGVFGMPNVGKSSLMNLLIGRAKTKTGNKAGVTRQTQWVRVDEQLELLDTPGLIPPKLIDQVGAQLLAAVYGVSEKAFSPEAIAQFVLHHLSAQYENRLKSHFQLQPEATLTIENIAHSRKWLLKQDSADTLRTAHQVLKDLQTGRLGPITLEWPTVHE